MLNPEINAAVQTRLKTLQVIAIALILGVAMFAAIAAGVSMSRQARGGGVAGPPSSNRDLNVLRYVAGALVFSGCVVALVMVARSSKRASLVSDVVQREQDEGQLFGRFFTVRLTAYALLEGPALFGAVLVLLGGNLFDLAIVAVPLACMLLIFPTSGKWEAFTTRK
jgi:hypothetical protein